MPHTKSGNYNGAYARLPLTVLAEADIIKAHVPIFT